MPVTPDTVETIIERERPEGIILSMGGQTGLNCGVALEKSGVLEKYGVRVLGTSVAAIEATEDRGIFSDKLNEIGERIAPSFACDTLDEALEASKTIGFPCMVRCAFALGGLGSALIDTEEKFEAHCREAFASTPQALAAGCGRGGGWAVARGPRPFTREVCVDRSSSRSRSRGGRRSSTRWCATWRTTASPSATWRTSTRSACTRASRS